ncbi:alpha/beta fold superfamily hydrolase [Oleiphilus messinensis]|uniref:Alpha/beta fold superfamily hydrolase n=1 Tax=Oleiphilus messinensis TaxID=141451 RepID=A0A1Y0I4N4_9GAMM|nr:alpha/beta fold hydrolase [Oleiphilus messinensis]ARU54495.1 alpha/beta fold superfamily hydrolase [Oleiphilus messinensis]
MNKPQPHHLVIFSHGKESGPWGGKITRLAEVASTCGCDILSVDYQGMESAEQRITTCLDSIPEISGKLILVGSSMGAYVSIEVSQQVNPAGLFLLAPALGIPGYPNPSPKAVATSISVSHGWHDELIPAQVATNWAREHNATCHLYNDDHRLLNVIDQICVEFRYFLDSLLAV